MEKSFKKSNLLFMILVILSGILLSITNYKQYIKAASKPNLTYAVNIQDSGWLKTVGENQLAGSTGKGKRAEAIKINLKNSNGSSAISYSTHIQGNGWQNYVTSGKVSGTTGEEKRMEAIKIQLTGNLSKIYDIYYRVHIAEYGWLGWAKNNEKAGSEGISTAIEAIQIRLVKKETKIKQSLAYIEKPELTYCSHISDVGWQSIVKESNVSGTTGEGKRMEAMKLYLKNSNGSSAISYNTHLAGIGWQGWKSSGEVAGTVGEQRQVEAVKIKLTGLASDLFHIYYRVHVRGYGWLGWAKDGELAGTEGANLRIEAIQIEILPKGQSKEQTISGFIKPTLTYQTHVSNIGWQSSVSEGMIAGATEQSKAIEAMVINFNDASGNSGISYNLHLQGIGWQGWKSSGEVAGTVGEERRAEAIQIKLSDTLAQDYDVYYRTYIENHGWLAYAKNGETAGSSGLSLRMEALQIYIISKYVNFDQGDIAYVTQENVILPPNNSTNETTDTTYAKYTGVDYVNSGISSQRIAALDKAKAMTTVLWTATASFPAWQSSTGYYNPVRATDGTINTRFLAGKTYQGIPYSMANHSYDDIAWLQLVKSGLTSSSMSTRYGTRNSTTAKGVDCSYFTYLCFKAANTGYSINYQTTSSMLKSRYYSKKSINNIRPGDIALKSGHVMLYAGRSGNNYAFFEADAEDSKCSYNIYSYQYINNNYRIYKFNGFTD